MFIIYTRGLLFKYHASLFANKTPTISFSYRGWNMIPRKFTWHMLPRASFYCKNKCCHEQVVIQNTQMCNSLRWRHNDRDGVSNHQPHECLLNRLFRRRSKKTSKLRVTGLCVGNSPGTGEFPAQRASYAENVSIWWRHHVYFISLFILNYTVSEKPSAGNDMHQPIVYSCSGVIAE